MHKICDPHIVENLVIFHYYFIRLNKKTIRFLNSVIKQEEFIYMLLLLNEKSMRIRC